MYITVFQPSFPNSLYYEATTFPNGPYQGCELYLRRLKLTGQLEDDGAGLVIDVLDSTGSIIQDFPISRRGFNRLRSQLKFRREME